MTQSPIFLRELHPGLSTRVPIGNTAAPIRDLQLRKSISFQI
jgi:hypothetical protein